MGADGPLVDRELRCRDCGGAFTFPAGEQVFFTDKGFRDPIRCPACRGLARQAAREAARGEAPNTTHICRECLGAFQLSTADTAWYAAKALHLPTRCVRCRRQRREAARVCAGGVVE